MTTTISSHASPGIQSFDARQTIISRKKKEFLEKVFNEFGQSLAKILVNYVSLPVQLSVRDIQYFTFGTYQKKDHASLLTNLFGMEPMGGAGLLRIESKLILVAMDRILGGTGNVTADRDQLSLIELKMSEALINQILNRLNGAMETYAECDFHLQSMSQNLGDAKVFGEEDPLIVATLEMKLGSTTGILDACFPSSFWAPIFSSVEKQEKQSFGNFNDPKIIHVVKEKTGHVALPLSVFLGEMRLNIKELTDLEKGHVICLGSVDKDLLVKVDRVPVFWAKPGVANNNLAIKVTKEFLSSK